MNSHFILFLIGLSIIVIGSQFLTQLIQYRYPRHPFQLFAAFQMMSALMFLSFHFLDFRGVNNPLLESSQQISLVFIMALFWVGTLTIMLEENMGLMRVLTRVPLIFSLLTYYIAPQYLFKLSVVMSCLTISMGFLTLKKAPLIFKMQIQLVVCALGIYFIFHWDYFYGQFILAPLIIYACLIYNNYSKHFWAAGLVRNHMGDQSHA